MIKNNMQGTIDIGSNTVLMTCGKINAAGKLEIIDEAHEVARLSESLQDGKPLNSNAKARVLKILEKFQHQAKEAGIQDLRAAGTAAFRRASDGQDFAEEIERKLGIPVQILTGQQEANYSYLSAKQDFENEKNSISMIDIGGGSTEIVWGKGHDQWISLPLGTVRFAESEISNHPICDQEWNLLKQKIHRELEQAKLPTDIKLNWIAVAATPTALASLLQELPQYEPDKVHGFSIQQENLIKLTKKLRTMSLEDRKILPGMDPKRAELLPLGGLILQTVMEFFEVKTITASHHGLRYGMLWKILNNQH